MNLMEALEELEKAWSEKLQYKGYFMDGREAHHECLEQIRGILKSAQEEANLTESVRQLYGTE